MTCRLWIERLDGGAGGVWFARAQAIGEACADADQPRRDRIGRHVEHAAGVDIVEALAIDEQQGEPLLRRQVAQEAVGEVRRTVILRRNSWAKLASSALA